ncbi:adenine DNA glycosylase-like [Penaeus indicus]|uniref:adenine DNA glycosylase-like n=1 Tax=Penaeus indicus TaxID=29960 RepID=UPI00300D8F1F
MVKASKSVSPAVIGLLHKFSEPEVSLLREKLLSHYDANHRILPWRSIAATEDDRNKRAYAVWVSEMMLQQTQVATVISYFEKWISKWPTVADLSKATLEEVNQVWAGLGYYSRARRLHEGAVKVMDDLDGEFPSDRDSLVEQLPGVGRYTGSAIASIALGSCVGVVDGNVNRVMARLRGIGADISAQATVDHMWSLADQLVDPERPGDFNQAVMELGATVCTPKTPSCSTCPLQSLCVAYRRSQDGQQKTSISSHFKMVGKSKDKVDESLVKDIECLPECDLCLRKEDWDSSLGVQNYPRKGQKTQSRQETSAVVILQRPNGQMYFVQRPKTGLLANLWEFPSIALTSEEESQWEESITQQLQEDFAVPQSYACLRIFVSDVLHIFSHIRQTYKVYKLSLDDKKPEVICPSKYQGSQWMTREEFMSSATSTAMKKILKAVESSEQKAKDKKPKRGKEEKPVDAKKQKTISQFFNASAKKQK